MEGGGCHGYQYVYKLDDKFDNKEDIGIVSGSESEDEGVLKKDAIVQDGLINPPINVMPVVVDKMSLQLLFNSKLVYQQDVMGEQFVMVDNPIADKGCGCGVSFGVKENV